MSAERTSAKPIVPRFMPTAPLSRSVWGIPGPAWTMSAWATLASVLLFTSLLLPLTDSATFPTHTLLAAAGFAVIAVIPVIMRSRVPNWFSHAALIAWMLLTCMLIANAQPIEISLLFDAFIVMGVYVGYWMSAAQVRIYAAAWVTAAAGVLIVTGLFDEMVMVWVADSSVAVAVAIFVNTLTRYLGQQAIHDPLTGLLNRSGLEIAMKPIHARSSELQPVSIVVIDLDEFKSVNDSQGHLAGDQVLKDVATAIAAGLRLHDIAARSGGDEFILVLPASTASQANSIAQRIGSGFPCGWSYGAAAWGHEEPFDDALRRADAAMYENKKSKRFPTAG